MAAQITPDISVTMHVQIKVQKWHCVSRAKHWNQLSKTGHHWQDMMMGNLKSKVGFQTHKQTKANWVILKPWNTFSRPTGAQEESKQLQHSHCTYQSWAPLWAGAPGSTHRTARWGRCEEGQTAPFPLKCTAAWACMSQVLWPWKKNIWIFF